MMRRVVCLAVLTCIIFGGLPDAAAQTESVDPAATPAELRDDELAISGRYARFERLLSQMADVLGRDDPERAELLRRAVSKGREEKISDRISAVVALLESNDLGTAIEQQEGVADSLRTLLTLLQSEDRRSSVERERERLNDLLNDVRGLVEGERSARAAAQNAETPSGAAASQQNVMDDADALIDDVKKHDADKAAEGDAQAPSENSPPAETDPNSNPSEKPPNSSDPSSPSSGQPSDEGSQSQQGTPGRPQLEAARRAMQQALEQLREQQREKATQQQDEAIRELLKAAGELEEMLRQLREEEKEMILAALEARFQRMLVLQTQIHEATVELGKTPKDEWLDQYFGRCRELAQQQSQLAVDCSQTAGLLREDGTSTAILLAVEGIEADMQSAALWLQQSDAGPLTQSVQADILESLKELIEAMQREMQDMQSEERQQSPQSQGDQQKPPLVELMAEIKVLRSLQVRVNRRTKQVDQLLQQSQDAPDPLLDQLSELATRQQRLIESAQEIARQMEQ